MTFPTETVQIVKGDSVDKYGDPVAAGAADVDVDGVLVAPLTSSEPNRRNRSGVTVGWQLILPPGSPAIGHSDKIRVRGVLCDVEGEVAEWGNEGAVVTVKRATG